MTATPGGIDISLAVDGVFWGVIASTSLVGITVVQGWTYLTTCGSYDPWYLQLLVYTLLLMNFVCTILDFQFLHYYLVEHFGDLENLATQTPPFLAQYGVLLTVIFMTQMFFITRVYFFNTKDRITPLVLAILACLSYASGMTALSITIQEPFYAKAVQMKHYKVWSAMARFVNFACDILLTFALSWRLHFSRDQINKKTNSALERILVAIVSRGLIVTLAMMVSVILFLSNPNGTGWMIVDFCYSKIYVSTMLTMLNMRPSLRDQLAGTAITESGMKFHSVRSSLSENGLVSSIHPMERRFVPSRRHQDSLAILSTVTVETRIDEVMRDQGEPQNTMAAMRPPLPSHRTELRDMKLQPSRQPKGTVWVDDI